jgi:hypothetical protein
MNEPDLPKDFVMESITFDLNHQMDSIGTRTALRSPTSQPAQPRKKSDFYRKKMCEFSKIYYYTDNRLQWCLYD